MLRVVRRGVRSQSAVRRPERLSVHQLPLLWAAMRDGRMHLASSGWKLALVSLGVVLACSAEQATPGAVVAADASGNSTGATSPATSGGGPSSGVDENSEPEAEAG